jgi:hypothetical protein
MRAYATRVFTTAGIVNLTVGIAAFFAPFVTARMMGLERLSDPVLMKLTGLLVAVLGIAYCLTALNPERNRDLMLVGGIGKILVLPVMLSAWLGGEIGAAGLGGGAVDFVFALLFFDVMRRTPVPRPRPS